MFGKGKKPMKYLGKGWQKVRGSQYRKTDFLGVGYSNWPFNRLLIKFNERLFIGVCKADGLEIWTSFDGAIWHPCVGNGAKISAGFGDQKNREPNCAVISGNDLYVATQGGIWWTPDGDTWEKIRGIPEVNLKSIVPFQGRLYGVNGSWYGSRDVYSFDKFGNWAEVTKNGFGNPGMMPIDSLAVFRGHLYAGLGCDDSGSTTEVCRSNDGSNWTNFKKISPGWGTVKGYSEIHVMMELSGHLYIGGRSQFDSRWSIKLFRTNGEEGNWEDVVDGLEDGSPWSMLQKGNDLYLGLFGVGYPIHTLWISQDGKSWHQFDTKALFDENLFKVQTIAAMTFFNNYLYVITCSQETWRYGDIFGVDEPKVGDIPEEVVWPLIDLIVPESQRAEYESVVVSYDKEIEKHPENKWLWKSRGVALFKLGKYEDAIKSYNKAIEIDPNWIDVMTDKGRALAELEQYDIALQYYNKALKVKSDDAKIWIDKGLVLRKMGKAGDAVGCFNTAIEIRSKSNQYTLQHYPGSTSVSVNRRKHMSGKLEKLRDIAEADVISIMGHRSPGADYGSTHPPLKEMGEPDCPIRQIVTPTAGAAAGDRVRYSQFADSYYFAPAIPYWRSYWGAINCKGCDPGTLSGRQIIEARERDIEKYTKTIMDSEMFDPALCGMRGCTVHGHSLRLQENGMMFDMLARTEMGKDGNVYQVKDQVGIPLDKKLNLSKPMSDVEAKKRTTIFRFDGVAIGGKVGARKNDEAIEALHHMWELRSKWGFRPE